MGEMKINTSEIRSAASSVQTATSKLSGTLNGCRSSVNSLSGAWTGKASAAAVEAFNIFAEYFPKYEAKLNAFADFLQVPAGQGYENTESDVTNAANQI